MCCGIVYPQEIFEKAKGEDGKNSKQHRTVCR